MAEKEKTTRFAPVILAGGSGTRFWPRSRRARAKQVLALDGERTMIQQTLDRLLPLAAADDVWIITNALLGETIAQQLPKVPRSNILSEPAARNTAPACALAAFLLEPTAPETVIGIFPSDHVVGDIARFAEVIRAGIQLAAGGERIVVLGVPPTRPETGYGYIELGAIFEESSSLIPARRVRRFTEKPDRAHAEQFVASGNYVWNGGIFLWSARTLANAIREHAPRMAPLLEKIAAAHRSSRALSPSSIHSARTSPSTMLCWNRARRKAKPPPRYTACLRTLPGMISAPGPHCTNIFRATRQKAMLRTSPTARMASRSPSMRQGTMSSLRARRWRCSGSGTWSSSRPMMRC
jgi:mannose-1-phosphate guanylyltransferase